MGGEVLIMPPPERPETTNFAAPPPNAYGEEFDRSYFAI
jgi:hypothetical protein